MFQTKFSGVRFWFLIIALLAGCSTITKNRDVQPQTKPPTAQPPPPQPVLTPPESAPLPTPFPTPFSVEPVPQPTPPEVHASNQPVLSPKFGIILGPGQFKSFSHIGVLQELAKAKAPISRIVGIEWGSLIGSVYAHKGQVNEVEWQLSKLHEEDLLKKGLLASTFKSRSVTDLTPFIKGFFGSSRVESAKIPFACPVYEMQSQRLVWIERGPFDPQLLNCVTAPPLWPPQGDGLADVTAIKEAADYLRSKGANVVILVNVLGPRPTAKEMSLEPEARSFWALVQKNMVLQYRSVDFVIPVNTQEFKFTDVGRRRELIQRGHEAVQKVLPQMSQRFGL